MTTATGDPVGATDLDDAAARRRIDPSDMLGTVLTLPEQCRTGYALGRAIDSQSKDGAFVARDVLTRVIRPVLHREEAELNGDRFPSEVEAQLAVIR